jgi:hypothetical protein
MALRFTIQYADPNGPHPLAHDAAWQLYSSTDHADVALSDVEQAGRRHLDRQHARVFPPYAVRILDGGDVVMTDVPGAVPNPDDVYDLRDVRDRARDLIRRAELEDDKLVGELADALAALVDLTEGVAR